MAVRFDIAKADLATAMMTRMRALAALGGTVASVTPQNWLFLGPYKKMREEMLTNASLRLIAVLGEHGFENPAAAGAFTAMIALSKAPPTHSSIFAGLDANDAPNPARKAVVLREGEIRVTQQFAQLSGPDSRIAVGIASSAHLLSDYAISLKGIASGDLLRFIFRFWEIVERGNKWEFLQEPPTKRALFTSRSGIILWERDAGTLRRVITERLGEGGVAAWLRGAAAWGRSGVAVAQMRSLPVTLLYGRFI